MHLKPKSGVELADVRLSRRLAYLLRHSAEKEGLHIKPNGFIPVAELLSKIDNCTLNDIQRVVTNDRKSRFTLRECGIVEIKANQGHSIVNVDKLSLKLVKIPHFDIIHGTYMQHWPTIKIQGLSRMNRNHIHFAKNLNTECGLRQRAEIYIFIDFHRASNDGIKFFVSENGVILSSGDAEGFIKPKYFSEVINKLNETLLRD